MVNDNEYLYVKAKYGNDIRKVFLSRNEIVHLDNIERWSRATFDIAENVLVQIKYLDADGDLVTLTNDEDARVALKTESSIYFHIFSNGEDLRAEVAKINQEIASVKNMLDKLSLLLEEKTVHFDAPASRTTINSTTAVSAADEGEEVATIHPSQEQQFEAQQFEAPPLNQSSQFELNSQNFGAPLTNQGQQFDNHSPSFENSSHFEAPPKNQSPNQGQRFESSQFEAPLMSQNSPFGVPSQNQQQFGAPLPSQPHQLPPSQEQQFGNRPPSIDKPSQFGAPPINQPQFSSNQGQQFGNRPPSVDKPPQFGAPPINQPSHFPPNQGQQFGAPPINQKSPQFGAPPMNQGPPFGVPPQNQQHFGSPPVSQLQQLPPSQGQQFGNRPQSVDKPPQFGAPPMSQPSHYAPNQGQQFGAPPMAQSQFGPPSNGFQLPPLGPPPTNFGGGPPPSGPTGNIANPFARPPMVQPQRPGGYNY